MYLVGGDVGEGELRPVVHEDAHGRPDSDSLGVEPSGESIGEIVHFSERQRSTLAIRVHGRIRRGEYECKCIDRLQRGSRVSFLVL